MRRITCLGAAMLLAAAPSAPARAATVSAAAWSYETSQTQTAPLQAWAGITRQGPNAPGNSQAGAGASCGGLLATARTRGCGSEYNLFQDICNNAASDAACRDTLLVTAAAPVGTTVQLRVTLDLAGEIDGIGGYSYRAEAFVAGYGDAASGGTGGTVQRPSHLPLTATRVWNVTVHVGDRVEVWHHLSAQAFNRFCAGGSQDCADSATLWELFVNAGSTLRIEVLTNGIGAQITAASGHDYTAAPTAAPQGVVAPASLGPAWPNPSRGDVALTLNLAESGLVDVGVFDVAGRRVATLAGGSQAAGTRLLRWDGRDAQGRREPGVYFVRARGARVDLARRVFLLR